MKPVGDICDVEAYVSLHSPHFVGSHARVDSRSSGVRHNQGAGRLILSFYGCRALSDALNSVSYGAGRIQDKGLFVTGAKVIPGFGMIMATGSPEPCDGRWRDTINGASQDLSAAQRVEGRVREG